MIQIEELLSRLEKVKQTGTNKWQARCPAHADKSPSMSIKIADDGRVLMHDFAGCSIFDICGAIGIEVSDLFPPSNDTSWRSEETRMVGAIKFTALDALRCLAAEGGLLAIYAADQAEGRVLGPADMERLGVACERITSALGYLESQE